MRFFCMATNAIRRNMIVLFNYSDSIRCIPPRIMWRSSQKTNSVTVITWTFSSAPSTPTRAFWWWESTGHSARLMNQSERLMTPFHRHLAVFWLGKRAMWTFPRWMTPSTLVMTFNVTHRGTSSILNFSRPRNECVQRGHHVRLRSRHFLHLIWPAGRFFHHYIDFHHFLHHGHPLPRLRAKGNCPPASEKSGATPEPIFLPA